MHGGAMYVKAVSLGIILPFVPWQVADCGWLGVKWS